MPGHRVITEEVLVSSFFWPSDTEGGKNIETAV